MTLTCNCTLNILKLCVINKVRISEKEAINIGFCYTGPASRDVDVLVEMIKAGMKVVRLNFSHGTYEVILLEIMYKEILVLQ